MSQKEYTTLLHYAANSKKRYKSVMEVFLSLFTGDVCEWIQKGNDSVLMPKVLAFSSFLCTEGEEDEVDAFWKKSPPSLVDKYINSDSAIFSIPENISNDWIDVLLDCTNYFIGAFDDYRTQLDLYEKFCIAMVEVRCELGRILEYQSLKPGTLVTTRYNGGSPTRIMQILTVLDWTNCPSVRIYGGIYGGPSFVVRPEYPIKFALLEDPLNGEILIPLSALKQVS